MRYKEGFEFSLLGDSVVDFSMRVQDTRSSTPSTIRVSIARAIPLYARGDFRAFCHWFKEQLVFMELHELDEHFRVDGNLFRDPHKPAAENFDGRHRARTYI